MKTTMMAAVLAIAMLAVPLAALPASGDFPDRQAEQLVPVVDMGATERFDGGEWIRVRIGDVSVGVIWSTGDSFRSPGVRLFVDYVRYFGGAELHDDQGNHLRTIGLPVHTVLLQNFGRMVEFRDTNDDGLFDLRVENRTQYTGDYPLKILNLRTAWYLDGEVEQVVTDSGAWVNFTISASDVPYEALFDADLRMWRPATSEDGALDKISFTFRLEALVEEVTQDIPFYRIDLARGDERQPLRSEFIENRTVTGASIRVDGKYDQRIEGWDFSSFEDAKLALATPLTFGNFYPRPVVHWLQQQFGGACLRDGTFEHCESDDGPTSPVVVSRDRLHVAEEWHQAGEWYWVSGVTVDGVDATMTFEIYHALPITVNRGDRIYSGFVAFGAFVYPRGHLIFHDPGIMATSLIPGIADGTNLAPVTLVGLQLAVAAIALVPAVLLRRRARRSP